MENLFRNIVYGSMALTLLTTPVAAQQKMNEMWGNGQQAKEINNMGERGTFSNGEIMPCSSIGGYTHN